MEDFYEENEDVFTAIGAFAAVRNADQQAKNASNQRRDNAALREELRKQKDLLAEQNISNEKRLKIEEEILELNRRAAEKDDEERELRRKDREQEALNKEEIRKIRNFMADTIVSFDKLKRQYPSD